jgi:phage tail tape-measure protein
MLLMKIPRPILKLFRSPIVVVSAASFGVRIGKDVYKMRKGEIDKKEFRARAGTHLGSTTGGMAGAAAGAAAFSMVPGVGTVLGAFAGGMLGEAIGSKLGRRAAERVEVAFVAEAPAAAAADAEKSEPNDHGTHNPKRHL